MTKHAVAPKAPKATGGMIRRFSGSRAGNVAMMFGLAAIPFFAAGGLAVDYGRALQAKSKLSNALDATALAIGGQLNLTDAQIQAAAQAFFNANYPSSEIAQPGALQISSSNTTVTIHVDAIVPTVMMNVVGIDYVPVHAEVEVMREMKGLEVALVLDTTGSMADSGKIQALKQAGHDLMDILCGSSCSTKLKVGVVPFAAAVRLDPTAAVNGGWIDTTGTARDAKAHFSTRFAYQIYAPLTGSPNTSYQMTRKWTGCVEARTNKKTGSGITPYDYEVTDTAPTAGTPDSRWVPFFAPDEPNGSNAGSGWNNSYVNDISTSTNWQTRLKYSAKYANVNNVNVEDQCGMQPILDLTSTKATVLATIDALSPSGNTHVPIGLGWGWRLLSPTAPYTQGVAYSDTQTNKAVILMTDGANTIPTSSSLAGSDYTAYGYLYESRLGSTNATTAVNNMNTQLATLCTNVKATGIRVYTILLMENDTTIYNLLRSCATNTSMFFDTPSASQLQAVFRAIGADLSNLRISK